MDEAVLTQTNTVEIRKRNTCFIDPFSEETYIQTYKHYTDTDINATHLRVARELALAEKKEDRDFWIDKFLDILEDFRFVPGGRITSNAGTNLRGTTLINCFVSGPTGEYQDSMEGILLELRQQALILKSEGGYGFCADFIRPRGAYISAIANESPGAVKMLNMWDTQSDVITSGSGRKKSNEKGKEKIRKGAQMVTLSCWHPDVEEFITAKHTPGHLSKFNMSVLVTDEFMNAVAGHLSWRLEYPDYDFSVETKKEYNKSWEGNLVDWKQRRLPVKVFKQYDDANELWELILRSTYNRNEPGILFIDTINKLNNLYYCEYISATNPCGEQVLPKGGVCLLGSINLTQFINEDRSDWDYKKLENLVPTAVRFMDNVNDRTKVPLSIQKENLQEKRRIGLGVLGYASALMLMKVRYGSKKALQLTKELMDFIMNKAYQASALLAKEKGVFPLFDCDKYINGAFIQGLSQETKDLIKKHGLRNSHLLSIQPTGNSSILANVVSGGLEPVFLNDYVRTAMQPYAPEDLDMPRNVDWDNKKFDSSAEWIWKREGDENILAILHHQDVWKFDRTRGILKEVRVRDYATRILQEEGLWDPKANWAACTVDLNIDDHIKTMEVFSRYIDSAMSKTVNVPNEYSYDDFKRLYWDIFKTSTIKGCTTYRAGTMTSVLASKSTLEEGGVPTKIKKTKAPKRPLSLPCDIHQITAAGTKWTVLVGLLDEDPYEVFALRSKNIDLPPKIKKGILTKIKSNGYDLECEDGLVLHDVKEHFESDEHEALTRMISTALRHGADIEFIVSQLSKSKGTVVSFGRAVARTLKQYINSIKSMRCPECRSKQVIMSEGCFKCLDCSNSKCQ
jgi:ribonucleoside-diphosphate reductase alpha chain